MKPGFKTSEFWMTLAAMGAMIYSTATGSAASEPLVTAATGLVAAVYALARAITKKS